MTSDARIHGKLCRVAVAVLVVLPACTPDNDDGGGRLAALERRLAALEQRATRPAGDPDEIAVLRERVDALEVQRASAGTQRRAGGVDGAALVRSPAGAGTDTQAPAGTDARPAAPADAAPRINPPSPEFQAALEEYRGRMAVIREEFEGQLDSPEYRQAMSDLFEWFRQRRGELIASGQASGAGPAGSGNAPGGMVEAQGGGGGMGVTAAGPGTPP